ncbi:extracellular solute-binding protein [uncultured Pseudokineococcus sp.]|uniref:sugar ABC transporter substrate-binding protein n=1 Tax=uncultured Pseudokineococcus sp. TaxID=1642928 RepID=UPI00261F362C|nr:extracellular solute-binding protein [uncultured Pseudokineococcus sp.]
MVRRGTSRRTLAAALALGVPLALAGCGGDEAGGGSGGDGGAVDSLRVLDYYNNEPDNTFYQDVIDACGEGAGITIERQSVPGGDLISTVLQQSSSRTLPDVLMLDNPDLQQIAESGALAPLGDFGLTADGYADGVVQASSYEGELYGLQPVTNTIALFYNETLLAEAGVAPPTTWDELESAAAALTTGDQYGLAFSAINTYEGTWQFLPFMWSNGGDESDIATPETAEALQLWVDLVQSGSASQSVVNWSQADVNDQFAAGNAAMQVNGHWQFPVLDDTEGLEYGVVQIPAPSAGETVVAPFGGETWTVPQTGDADRQAAAAELVECITSDENMTMLATQRGTVPTKPELVDDVVAETPAIEPFAQQLPDLRSRTGELGAEWPTAATAIYTAVQDALVNGTAPAEALAAAQSGS